MSRAVVDWTLEKIGIPGSNPSYYFFFSRFFNMWVLFFQFWTGMRKGWALFLLAILCVLSSVLVQVCSFQEYIIIPFFMASQIIHDEIIITYFLNFISSYTETLCPLNNNSLFLHSPQPLYPLFYFLSLKLPILGHVSGIIQYSSFCVWLISPAIIFSRFIYGIECIKISFFF